MHSWSVTLLTQRRGIGFGKGSTRDGYLCGKVMGWGDWKAECWRIGEADGEKGVVGGT